MGIVRVIGGKDKYKGDYINTTTSSTTWSKGLSPMYLGPVHLYNDYYSMNVENGWKYSKLYPEYADTNENPTQEYYKWAMQGWSNKWANRYPMGKGTIPLCSIWKGKKYSYVEARKKIYIPLYAKAVVKSPAYKMLKQIYDTQGEVTLWDYDGYDYLSAGVSLEEVMLNPNKKMGHAFVLAMLLTGKIEVKNNQVIFN